MLSFVSFVIISFLAFFATVSMSFVTHSAQGPIFGVDVGSAAFMFSEKTVTLWGGATDTPAFESQPFYPVLFAFHKIKTKLLLASTPLLQLVPGVCFYLFVCFFLLPLMQHGSFGHSPLDCICSFLAICLFVSVFFLLCPPVTPFDCVSASRDELHIRKMKLDYQEVGQCSKDAQASWERKLTAPGRTTVPQDMEEMYRALCQGEPLHRRRRALSYVRRPNHSLRL